MIWLVKTREKAISDGAKNLYVYLKDCMEPAEKYIKHIKSKKLTPDILKDAEFHLYQLMEIYVSCKIVARWLCLKTKSEQLDFFHHLTDVRDLKEICDFSDSYCSQFEYNSFSNQMRKKIAALYDENINDVKKAFQECVSTFNSQVFENGLTESDAITSMISFYINQGVWTALRIIPTRLCTYEKIIFQGQERLNFDYISNYIMTFDKKFVVKPIYNNLQFYNESARDCFIFLLTLAKKLYDSNIEDKLEVIQSDIEALKKVQNNFFTEQRNLNEQFREYIFQKKQGDKITYYMSLPQNELIKLFYQIYEVPNNFLDIIQTYPFEDKIILNENFRIADGFQALLITYLDRKAVGKKDMALLKILFHITAKNPQPAKAKYVDRLDNFNDFIKKYAK